MDVQVGLSQQPFELGVLALQLTQPLRVGYIHAAELGPPLVEGGVAEAGIEQSFQATKAAAKKDI